MIESRGDYRNEVHLERVIGGRLYENQTTLRNLPVPTLKDTIDRFLPTALPLGECMLGIMTIFCHTVGT